MLTCLACVHSDYSKGFGGKFGVQKDRQDKSAAGWDHIEKVDKHESQKGAENVLLCVFVSSLCFYHSNVQLYVYSLFNDIIILYQRFRIIRSE